MPVTPQKPFPAYRGTDPFFFVCYAHHNAGVVYPELERLNAMGANIWYDEGITPGSEWSESLAAAIRSASNLLLFVSPESIKSKHCRDEISYAQDNGIPIVCIYLEPTSLTEGLKLSLSSNQAIMKYEITERLYEQKLQLLLNTYASLHRPDPVAQSGTKYRPRKLQIAGILLASIVLAAGISFFYNEQNSTTVLIEQPKGQKTIAVLPFVNLSNDPQNEFFADGLTDTLIHRLSQLNELKVTARTSAFSFKGSTENIESIAEQLGVGNILDGSVQHFGDQIRVFAKLTNIATNDNIWSEQFDMRAQDIFRIHDEIATSVTTAMQLQLLGQSSEELTQHQTDNLKAYESYLLGLAMMDRLDFVALDKSVRHFENAIAADPTFAIAYTALAHNYITQFIAGRTTLTGLQEQTAPLLARAFDLDPQMGEVFSMRGVVTALSGNNKAGVADLESAIRLNPNSAISKSHLAGVLAFTNTPQRSSQLALDARFLDPMGAWPRFDFLFASQRNGDFDQAWTVIETGDQAWDYFFQALYHSQITGRYDLALKAYEAGTLVDPLDPEYPVYASFNYLDLQQRDKALFYLENARAINSEHSLVALNAALYEIEYGTVRKSEELADAARAGGWPHRFNSGWLLTRILRDQYLAEGDAEGALTLYDEVFPRVRSLDLEGTWPIIVPAQMIHVAIDLSMVLDQLGQSVEAESLRDAADQAIDDSPRMGLFGFGLADVEILALRGEKEAALNKFKTAIDENFGHLWRFQTVHNRNLDSLKDNPRYVSLLHELELKVHARSGLR